MTPAFTRRRGGPGRLPWRTDDRQGQPVTIRVTVAHDATEYLAHMQRIVSETHYMLQCHYDPLPSVEAQRRLIDQLARSENSLSLVAYRPGAPKGFRVAGSATLLGGRSRRTQHVCSLGMGVDRTDWGRGLGGMLLDAALAWARTNPQLMRLGLQVFTDNHAARALYVSRGFDSEGEMHREVLVGGSFHPLEGMSLDVSRREGHA